MPNETMLVDVEKKTLRKLERQLSRADSKAYWNRKKEQFFLRQWKRIKGRNAQPISKLLRGSEGILLATAGVAGSGVGFIIGHSTFGTQGALIAIPTVGILTFCFIARVVFNATLFDIEATKQRITQARTEAARWEAAVTELEPLIEQSEIRVQEAIDAQRLEDERKAKAKSEVVKVQPSTASDRSLIRPAPTKTELVASSWESLPPTEKQIGFAAHLGIPITGRETRGQLSMMIDRALDERDGARTQYVYVQNTVVQPRSNPGIATLFNIFWPGIGQIYQGRALVGLFFMFCTPIGYLFCLFPGIVLHIIAILDVALYRPK